MWWRRKTKRELINEAWSIKWEISNIKKQTEYLNEQYRLFPFAHKRCLKNIKSYQSKLKRLKRQLSRMEKAMLVYCD